MTRSIYDNVYYILLVNNVLPDFDCTDIPLEEVSNYIYDITGLANMYGALSIRHVVEEDNVRYLIYSLSIPKINLKKGSWEPIKSSAGQSNLFKHDQFEYINIGVS